MSLPSKPVTSGGRHALDSIEEGLDWLVAQGVVRSWRGRSVAGKRRVRIVTPHDTLDLMPVQAWAFVCGAYVGLARAGIAR